MRDKVIQTENNYKKEVFNGDIGTSRRSIPSNRNYRFASTTGWCNTNSESWTKSPWPTP